jgi:hypothetical protein
MSATTGNFIEGGAIDPFTGRAPGELTLAQQARLEDERRQRELRATAANTANINRVADVDPSKSFNTASTIDPKTGKPMRPKVDNSLGGILVRGGKTVEQNPWVIGMPLAPLAMASMAPAAGAGGAGGGADALPGYAIKDSIAPTISRVPSAFPAGIATPGAATAATAPAAAAPAAGAGAEAFSVGSAIKEAVPIIAATAPLAYNAIAGGRTKEEKALVAKQEQMAREAETRRFEVQEARMNSLGQQLLAMNPRNQMMAQMYGPQAAFQPQEFAAMTQNPNPEPSMPDELKRLEGNTKPLTPEQKAAYAAFERRKQQYAQGNQQRSEQMMNGMAPVGPGAAPLQARTPQDARKY